MAYNKSTAQRVRDELNSDRRFSEKKMFGGVGFLMDGHMCVGVWKEWLILRVGPDAWQDLLGQSDVHEFDITGRSMTGWVMIAPDGFDTTEQLQDWISRAVAFTQTLPPKPL